MKAIRINRRKIPVSLIRKSTQKEVDDEIPQEEPDDILADELDYELEEEEMRQV
jgi:hypothetical protein